MIVLYMYAARQEKQRLWDLIGNIRVTENVCYTRRLDYIIRK